jgi:hypothetical protein
MTSKAAGFTLTRTPLIPPSLPNHGRFWSCAGGKGAPLQRLTLFQNSFQELDTSEWMDPPNNWTEVNQAVLYVDTSLNGLYLEKLGVSETEFCQCSLFDYGYSEWLYNQNADLAVDYWHGVEQESRPPANWFEIKPPEKWFDTGEPLEDPYDPNDFAGTKGIRQVYTGPTVGTGSFGFLNVEQVKNGEKVTNRSRLLKIQDQGKPFTLRAMSSSLYDIRVYLVSETSNPNRPFRALADKLLTSLSAEVREDTNEHWENATAYIFENSAPKGSYYAVEIGSLGAVNPKATRINWSNGPGPADYSGSPDYTCKLPSSVSETSSNVILNLESCNKIRCDDDNSETVSAPNLDQAFDEDESGAVPFRHQLFSPVMAVLGLVCSWLF